VVTQHLRGYIYLMLGDYNYAFDDLDKSLVLGIDPSIALAITLNEKENISLNIKYGNALSKLTKLLNIEQNNALVLQVRGKIYYLLQQYENALNDINKLIEIQPGNVT